MPTELDILLEQLVINGSVRRFGLLQVITLPPYSSAVLRRFIDKSEKSPDELVTEALDTMTILDDASLHYVRNQRDEVLRFPAPEDDFSFDEPHIRIRPDAEPTEVAIPYSLLVRVRWHAENNKMTFDEYLDAAFRYCAIISYNKIPIEIPPEVVAPRRLAGISQYQLPQPKGASLLPAGLGRSFSLN